MMNPRSIYNRIPSVLQDLVVGTYGGYLAAQRYGPAYFKWKKFYRESGKWTRDQLEAYQAERLGTFLREAAKTPYWRDRLAGIDISGSIGADALRAVPVQTKDDLRAYAQNASGTLKGISVHTGGTTGTPLEVTISFGDFQERQARLTVFRGGHGAELGMRRATFSGRVVVGSEESPSRFWCHNWALNQRLYSSFHLRPECMDRYIDDLEAFSPEWLDGFPSSIYAVAQHALDQGRRLACRPRVAFSTSETLYDWQREAIREAFGCPIRNQYASAEGAPFVVECPEGRLHADLRTGVFEHTDEGDLLVTSFTTTGVPLIRYAIGDRIEFAQGTCSCGDQNPLVAGVYGRDQDSVLSPDRGPVFVGLVDIFKLVPPVVQSSQVAQTEPQTVELRLVTEAGALREEHEVVLLEALRDRLGHTMGIQIKYVDTIPRDASGKYRFIKREW